MRLEEETVGEYFIFFVLMMAEREVETRAPADEMGGGKSGGK